MHGQGTLLLVTSRVSLLSLFSPLSLSSSPYSGAAGLSVMARISEIVLETSTQEKEKKLPQGHDPMINSMRWSGLLSTASRTETPTWALA